MNQILDSLLHVLNEETRLYRLALELSQKENESMVGSHLDAFRETTERKTSLVVKIQELEQDRQVIIKDLAEALGQPSDGFNLGKLAQMVEETYARKLRDCRSNLVNLINALSEINSRNREFISHSLKVIKSGFLFLNNLTASNTVYQCSGRMMTSRRSGRVLSGEF